MSTVDRAGRKPCCSRDVFALAVVAQARGDELEQDFPGVRHEGDASVVAALRRILLLEQYLDGGVLPLLRYLSRPPHVDDVVELLEEGSVPVERV